MLPVIAPNSWPSSWNQEFVFEPSIYTSTSMVCNPCVWKHELLRESQKHPAVKLLRQIPSIGPIRATLLVALLQTPHRFRTKRQLWAYSGFAAGTHDGGEYRWVRG
jgi:hypothetical protein